MSPPKIDGYARTEAKQLIRELLSAGKALQSEIHQAAEDRGIAKNTLYRAKKDLAVASTKGKGADTSWYWELPR